MKALNTYSKFFWVLALVLCAFGVNVQAQDEPQFAQYQFSRALFNPAANGIEDGFSGLLMHRSQWAGFNDAPHAQGLSLQGGLKSINSGIGLTVTNTGYGVTNALSIGIAYAYHLPLGKKYRLSFGIQGDLKVNSDNGSALTTTGSGDSEYQQDVTLYTGNFGAGLMFHSERLFVGVSTTRFLNNEINYSAKATYTNDFDAEKIPFYVTAGYAFLVSPDFSLMPSAMVRSLADQPIMADFNLNLKYKDIFWIGPYYRLNAAVGGMAGVNISNTVRIGYAGEFPLSALSPYTKGSHEVFISFNIRKKNASTVPSIRYF